MPTLTHRNLPPNVALVGKRQPGLRYVIGGWCLKLDFDPQTSLVTLTYADSAWQGDLLVRQWAFYNMADARVQFVEMCRLLAATDRNASFVSVVALLPGRRAANSQG